MFNSFNSVDQLNYNRSVSELQDNNMERRSTVKRDEWMKRMSLAPVPETNNNSRKRNKNSASFTNIAFANENDEPAAPTSPSNSPRRKFSRRFSVANQLLVKDERNKKDVIAIVVIILIPIAALIGLTISQVVRSSQIRDDAVQAKKDIDNFLRVRALVDIAQSERDLSSAFMQSNGTDRGVEIFLTGKRQSLDIALRKIEPWPKTSNSPSYLRTKGNLKLFLTTHRAGVDDLSQTVTQSTNTYSQIIQNIVDAAVANVNLPEKGNLWRDLWAASELTVATSPMGVQVMLTSQFIRGCLSPLESRLWFHEMTGEFNKHLFDALRYSPKAAQKYQTLGVDSGEEAKSLEVREQVTNGAYEQPCRMFNDTVRFGIFWGWNRMVTNYLNVLNIVGEQLAMEATDELNDIVDDAERDFLIYVVVLCVFVFGCLILAIWTTYGIYKMIGDIITFTRMSEDTSKQVSAEKRKGDMILCDILPATVVDDIKSGKNVQVEYFDAVTICYIDIVRFVAMISNYSPVDVVTLLNNLYHMFDEIIEKHNVHKIEQNNDVYCVASGVPSITNKHTMNVSDFLLEIMDRIPSFEVPSMPDISIQVRAGAHTGPCAAGIVGTTIPRYSVFGETVKVASRMSRTGEVMKIQISDQMRSALHARCGQMYIVQERGEIPVYGKGTMKTHFLLGKISGATMD